MVLITLPLSVDLVIPTWNGRDIVLRCLGALPGHLPGLNVIVVDNGSTDGSAAAIKMAHPHVTVVELPANVGFGQAINRGALAGKGEIIATINNDVIVCEGVFPALVRPFLARAELGSVAAILLDGTGRSIDAVGVEVDPLLQGYSTGHGQLAATAASLAPGIGPCGGAAAYRRTAFESVGGFDPEIFLYGEDVDLALRLGSKGWETELAHDALVLHQGGATAGRHSEFQNRHAAWSRGYLLARYRRPAPDLMLEVLLAVISGAVMRSLIGLRARWAGYRHGLSLPARHLDPHVITITRRAGISRQRAER